MTSSVCAQVDFDAIKVVTRTACGAIITQRTNQNPKIDGEVHSTGTAPRSELVMAQHIPMARMVAPSESKGLLEYKTASKALVRFSPGPCGKRGIGSVPDQSKKQPATQQAGDQNSKFKQQSFAINPTKTRRFGTVPEPQQSQALHSDPHLNFRCVRGTAIDSHVDTNKHAASGKKKLRLQQNTSSIPTTAAGCWRYAHSTTVVPIPSPRMAQQTPRYPHTQMEHSCRGSSFTKD